MRGLLVLAVAGSTLIAGCGRIAFDLAGGDDGGPRGDGTTDAVMVTPQCASWGPWTTPIDVPEFIGNDAELDPCMRGDGLELWFVIAPGMPYRIMTSTRATKTSGFSTAVPDPDLNDLAFRNTDPTATGNGLEIYFMSDRSGGARIYHSTRASVSTAWSSPVMTPELAAITPSSISVVPDGSALYVEVNGVVTRYPRTGQRLGAGQPVSVPEPVQWISISEDELELFYDSGSQVARLTRATPSGAFGNKELLPTNGNSADSTITADGTELWWAWSDRVWMMSRACQ